MQSAEFLFWLFTMIMIIYLLKCLYPLHLQWYNRFYKNQILFVYKSIDFDLPNDSHFHYSNYRRKLFQSLWYQNDILYSLLVPNLCFGDEHLFPCNKMFTLRSWFKFDSYHCCCKNILDLDNIVTWSRSFFRLKWLNFL